MASLEVTEGSVETPKICEFDNITSEGYYTETQRGTASYNLDEEGDYQDCLDSEFSETDDWEYNHDHYVCHDCHEEFGGFDCEIDRDELDEATLDRSCCVKCHTYQGVTAPQPQPEPEEDQSDKLLSTAEAREVIEELLKGQK